MPKITMKKGENDFIGGIVFHKRVVSLLEDSPEDEMLTIDLSNLYLDSSVIGTLLAIHTSCNKKNRELVIENVSDATMRVLSATGLQCVLNIPGKDTEAGK